jgi:hypothetical protein
MSTISGRLVVLSVVAVTISCAPRGSPETNRAPDHDVITIEQIRERRFQTAYDAVEALHGNWLLTRGTDSFRTPSEVVVYEDGTKLGGIAVLKDIVPGQVEYIRHFDGIAATARWGVGHSQGVIFVSTVH